MESNSIGPVVQVTTGSAKPATPRSTPAATTKQAAHGAEAKRQEAASSTENQIKVPQRDPRSLQYQVDSTTHRVVATIVDEGSKTVVRQIPDAEVLRIAQAIDRMQGFLIEESA